MGMISIPLISRTEVLWNLHREKMLREEEIRLEKEKEKYSNIGVGMALGLGVIGAIFAVKNTLF